MKLFAFLISSVAIFADVLVLGVIDPTKGRGVALVKDPQTSKTFVVREGGMVKGALQLQKVGPKQVLFSEKGRQFYVAVGDLSSQRVPFVFTGSKEIEKTGNEVRLTESYRDHIIQNELGSVLMQAAAVPKHEGGQLVGFTFWEIEPGSLYEKAGLSNGDTVVAIDGEPIQHVGTTLKKLNSLRQAKEVRLAVRRGSKDQEITVIVN